MKLLFFFWICFFCISGIAQEKKPSFREDQIFFGIAYPYFSGAPTDVIQNKLSYAFSVGFVRDIPLNTKRTVALGLGLGWDQAMLFNNAKFSVASNTITSVLLAQEYKQNHLSVQSLAFPLEIRWRNATEDNHAFWRIYSGISLHVPIQIQGVFVSEDGIREVVSLPSTSTLFRWNAHFGFNTWNISISHDLQPWASSSISKEKFNIKLTKIGLIFYLF